jgi:methionyl-tRNA synthetase
LNNYRLGVHKSGAGHLGNVVSARELEKTFGIETYRYVWLRDMTSGLDATLTFEGYVNSVNAALANGIGDLAARVLTLCQKNFAGMVDASALYEVDKAFLDLRGTTLEAWEDSFAQLKFHNALRAWSELVSATDQYVNENKPWALAKDPAQSVRLQTIWGVCCHSLAALGAVIAPVLPTAALRLFASLGLETAENGAISPGSCASLETRVEAEP